MTADSHLPTVEEILSRAAEELDQGRHHVSEAASWLRSDWQPLGSPLTSEQAGRRDRMWKAIEAAKVAIDQSKRWG